ncbi:MAG TPA: universal stress protein [Polyangiaceae bacterium]|nr:universal stress protein [Polyangiaceae bacterium]
MNEKPYVIVVGLDYSELADAALSRTFELASREQASEIHVISVLSPGFTDPSYAPKAVALDAEAASVRLTEYVAGKLREFASLHGSAAMLPGRVVSHVRVDSPANGVAQLASELEADLVVVGTHGRKGLSRLVLGSVSESVLRLAPCPVLIVRPKAQLAAGPTIEPPCSRCLETRAESAGGELWCAQHRERHGRRHTFHQSDRAGMETNFPLISH